MKRSLLLALLITLPACSTINCNFTGSNNSVKIEQPKSISTDGTLTAKGNTIPVSAVP